MHKPCWATSCIIRSWEQIVSLSAVIVALGVSVGSRAAEDMHGTVGSSADETAAETREAHIKLIRAGGLCLPIDLTTGRVAGMSVVVGASKEWTHHAGEVIVRDDLLRRVFTTEDLEEIKASADARRLCLKKRFRGAPWRLEEVYSEEPDCIRWDAQLILPKGEFRSVAISWEVPMPANPYPWQVWTARHDMPKDLCKTANEEIEFAEPTCGTLIPAFAIYLPGENWGFAVCKPFGSRTPCLRFCFGLREPRFRVRFDHLALSAGHPASAALFFRGIPGCWRPVLGWVVGRYREYFESSSKLLPRLWGGHNCSGYDQSEEEIAAGRAAGERWCEIHAHFPAYGQYDAQQEHWISMRRAWRMTIPGVNVPVTEAQCAVSLDKVRDTIARLNQHGIAPLPYIQLSGDASPPVAERFPADEIRNLHGELVSWPECGSSVTVQMNADDGLAFGRHLDAMFNGVLDKYTGAKGLFVDQACYNFIDRAHFDGITAIDNRPCYMTGFNYWNRLQRVAARVHPDGVIMANGPHSIEIMRHIDGTMAEALDWVCDQQKYLTVNKPMYFLLYDHSRTNVELMLQNALVHAAGYTAAGWSKQYQDIYDAYVPLLRMLDNRRWVFDANPLTLPPELRGDIYRAVDGSYLVALVRQHVLEVAPSKISAITIRPSAARHVSKVELYLPGGKLVTAKWKCCGNEIVVESLPVRFVAGLLRITVSAGDKPLMIR
jgi:hypothetical protein